MFFAHNNIDSKAILQEDPSVDHRDTHRPLPTSRPILHLLNTQDNHNEWLYTFLEILVTIFQQTEHLQDGSKVVAEKGKMSASLTIQVVAAAELHLH